MHTKAACDDPDEHTQPPKKEKKGILDEEEIERKKTNSEIHVEERKRIY